MGRGWLDLGLGRTGILFFLFLTVARSFALPLEDSGCANLKAFKIQAPRHSFEKLRTKIVVDQNKVLITGQLHVVGKAIYWYPDWNEPILIASGDPLILADEVQLLGNLIILRNTRVY